MLVEGFHVHPFYKQVLGVNTSPASGGQCTSLLLLWRREDFHEVKIIAEGNSLLRKSKEEISILPRWRGLRKTD